MLTYQEACEKVKTTKMVIHQTGLGYDDKAIKCATTCMNLLLQEIYGVGVFEVEKDTE